MAWTNIANANLDIGAPIRSVDLLALRDNISAVPNGDAGAPKVQTNGIQDAAITAAKLNGAQSGSAPIYAARAWVNFDGHNSPYTIRASGNVSSVTFSGLGTYVINFTTAMPNANYSVAGCAGGNGGSSASGGVVVEFTSNVAPVRSTTQCGVRTFLSGIGSTTRPIVNVNFFG
jgi:hypothetical protein